MKSTTMAAVPTTFNIVLLLVTFLLMISTVYRPPLHQFELSEFVYQEALLYNETYSLQQSQEESKEQSPPKEHISKNAHAAAAAAASSEQRSIQKRNGTEHVSQKAPPSQVPSTTKKTKNTTVTVSSLNATTPSKEKEKESSNNNNNNNNNDAFDWQQQRLVENPATYLPIPTTTVDSSWSKMKKSPSSPSSSQQQPPPPPRSLSFLSIPETGGEVVERVAAKVGLWSWGRQPCSLFLEPPPDGCVQRNTSNSSTDDDDDTSDDDNTEWQLPLQYDPSVPATTNNKNYNKNDIFVVVRNPYVRAVAAYRRSCQLRLFEDDDACPENDDSGNMMNQQIQRMLLKATTLLDNNNNNSTVPDASMMRMRMLPPWIPQYDYVYTTFGSQDVHGNHIQNITKVVRHILQLERLPEQFTSLTKAYGLEEVPLNADDEDHLLTAAAMNLTSETRALIEEVYSQDFALGGYLKIEHARRAQDPDQAYLPVPSAKTYSWKRQKDRPKRPLGFLHIPKTGGSSIENAAGEQGNLSWGLCLFHEQWVGCPNTGRNVSSHDLLQKNGHLRHEQVANVAWWHVPIQYLPINRTTNLNFNPNYTDPYRDQDIFVVIRNPYRRVVSEYYYYCNLKHVQCFGRERNGEKDTAEAMNKDIQSVLKRVKAAGKPTRQKKAPAGYYIRDGHWIPQYDFVFYDDDDDESMLLDNNNDDDDNDQLLQQQRRQVREMSQHVVHFEHLEGEFHSLMEAYGLHKVNLTLAKKKLDRSAWNPQQTVHSLTRETRLMIEDVYAQDFEMGGYVMLEKTKSQLPL